MKRLGKDKANWHGIILIVEICLCASFSNATLEQFFSSMNNVKTDTRNRLSSKCLNAVLRIRATNYSLQEFHDNHVDACVDLWYNSKKQRLGQVKRKAYKMRESNVKKRVSFNINDLSSSDSSSSDSASDTD